MVCNAVPMALRPLRKPLRPLRFKGERMLINFNVARIKEGVRRIVNGL